MSRSLRVPAHRHRARGSSACWILLSLASLTAQDHQVSVLPSEVFGRSGQGRAWVVTADPVWYELLVAYDALHHALDHGATAIASHYEAVPPATRSSRWLRASPLSATDRERAVATWSDLSAEQRKAFGTWLRAETALTGAGTPADLGVLAAQLAGRQLPDASASLLPRTNDWLAAWLDKPSGIAADTWRPTRTSLRSLLREVSDELERAPATAGDDARAALLRAWLTCTRATLARDDSRLTDVRLMNATAHLVLLRGTSERRLEPRLGGGRTLSTGQLDSQPLICACTPVELDALALASERIALCLPAVHAATASLGLPRHATLDGLIDTPRRHLAALQQAVARCGEGTPHDLDNADPLIASLSHWRMQPMALGPRLGHADEGALAHTLAIDPDAPGLRNALGLRFWQLSRPGAARLVEGQSVYGHEIGLFGGKAGVVNEPGFPDR